MKEVLSEDLEATKLGKEEKNEPSISGHSKDKGDKKPSKCPIGILTLPRFAD